MDVFKEIRTGARVFSRSPGFAAAIVLMLGLGIGANSAIFSVINGVLVQPLPYTHGDRLVRLRQGPVNPAGQPSNLSPLEVQDVRERAAALDEVVEYHTMFFNLLEEGVEPERTQVGVVSWNFFDVIGVTPLHGRAFNQDEDEIGAEPVLMLGYDYWLRRFGGDPGVVGHTVEMNNRIHRIVGVLPQVPTYPNLNDVWMPWYGCPFRIQDSWHLNRQARNLHTVARLAPGVGLGQATTEMGRIATDLKAEFGADYAATATIGADLLPLKEELTAGARPTFLILLGMAGLVLLIACANVANLTLARMNRRQQELAVRAALGASRGRIVGHLLTESLLLSLGGALVAVLIAFGSVDLLSTFASNLTPRFSEVRVDAWVLVFTGVVALLTGLVVGGVPGMFAEQLTGSLRESKGSGGLGRNRIRSGLVVAQVAVAFVLLVGSGLMIRSFSGLLSVDPGYRSEGVLTLTIDLDWARYTTPQDSRDFYDQLLRRVRERPQVVAAAVASDFPMSGNTFQSQMGILIDGETAEPGVTPPQINGRFVSDGYFEALEIPLVRGRTFESADASDAQPVAILGQAASARFFPDRDAVGQLVSNDGGQTWRTVVGVVGDVRQFGFEADAGEEIYIPYAQAGFARRLLVKTAGPAQDLARPLTEDVLAIDSRQPVSFVQTLTDAESANVASPRTVTALLGLFALIALVTAAAGILSVMAYSVSQRQREIGIRLAMGAERGEIVTIILRNALTMTAVGLGIGMVIALSLGGVMEGLLFGTSPTDPITFGVVLVALFSAAFVAAAVPAWKGTRVDPMVAFRTDG